MSRLLAIYYIVTLLFLMLFALYDIRHHKIRNAALIAFLIWCLFSVPLAAYTEPFIPWQYAILRSVIGFLTGFLILFTIAFVTNGGIGGGDIKLVAILGIPFGTTGLVTILLLGCVTALLYLLSRRMLHKSRPQNIPFAPYLFIGCLIFALPQLFI